MDLLSAALSRAASSCFDRTCWPATRRQEQHARLAIKRMHDQAQADLVALAARNRRLDPDQAGRDGRGAERDSLLGTELLGDFHRFLIASLREWADEATIEIETLSGAALAERRQSLLELRAEIRSICREIEAREASAD